jgi:hypothetical protein
VDLDTHEEIAVDVYLDMKKLDNKEIYTEQIGKALTTLVWIWASPGQQSICDNAVFCIIKFFRGLLDH